MSDLLKTQLKTAKKQNDRLNPDQSWVAQNRAKLMSQINNTVSKDKPRFRFDYVWQAINIFVPGRLAYTVVRPMAVFVLVGAVATSGWIASVGATQNCLPGEICYGVKLAAEKTQELVTSVAGAKGQQAQMHLEFATRRAKEVKKVVENKAVDAPQRAAEAMVKLEKSIQTANEAIKAVVEEEPEKIVEVVKGMQETAKDINQTLTVAAEQGGSEVDVAGTKQAVKDSSLDIVKTIVQKNEGDGKNIISDEDAKTMVQTQIDVAMQDTGDMKSRAEDAVKVLEAAPITSNNLPSDVVVTVSSTILISNSSIQVFVNSTTPIILPTSTIKNVLGDVNRQAIAQGQESQKTLEEAKVLVDGNHLLEAMGKVKDATQAAEEAERTVVEVKKAVDAVSSGVLNSQPVSTTTAIITEVKK
ncbi:MAG: hypothetical protein A2921_01460 [Candidatus Magasanikbacteria bacterium RIFCSPLOWO2_01_FULL_43_20b]|uniref:Uncharacterized protein n=1 Tax=Candidatus Magasanikbacteria bacterium RIFCSPLOWO2_12_FULL_43_12 TaxID=1798692 RepID=A0A1F6MV17_9BACT|nr:MAG: hypothetical protein A3C74_02460 [Candidatus Magasanikbacteria bacterium RIFCSPHIGHO2_02_FULL_44_13]OGH72781.1 MAG: hypothetical protein A3I93_00885 [Candidatus Magasanikbacteria bacterium RIFCSPLOWO2_02_FULL_43_22]OGH73228.1 MAG: hypothetical protein A2921_01460 [Candidatus Magasanikbacteria bacterium RIFCSPLOWO2_01_FULL_43_20b]OGH75536.1 MAG: hypothetical protein A3G00_00535 [Candidatus Magasanikbacteria bacterium RIFCSPLOWO2_12_FULL_43_12]